MAAQTRLWLYVWAGVFLMAARSVLDSGQPARIMASFAIGCAAVAASIRR
jgi:hypothetical protein